MAAEFPESVKDLLSDEKRAFAFLATIMPDGSPQVTPVWFDVEDGLIRINTARGRVKERNLRARPKVALAIVDPDDPYRYVQIRGTVVEEREEGAREHINRLARKYRGEPEFPWTEPPKRVMFMIRPDKVFTNR